MTHPLLAWASRMQAYARQPQRSKSRNILGKPKFDVKRCDTCPRLEHCQDFPSWRMGHHPEGRCPDGIVEKVLLQEMPGKDYFQPSTRYSKWWRQRSKRKRESRYRGNRVCLWCYLREKGTVTYITFKSRYRLCRKHITKFVMWKKRQAPEMWKRKRERYLR